MIEDIALWTKYTFFCDNCQNDVEIDHDASGEVVECDVCDTKYRVARVY